MNETLLKSVVFIDARVEGYQHLIEVIDKKYEIVIIKKRGDGIEKIGDILQKKDYDRVHIICYGLSDCFYVGNSEISFDTLDRYNSLVEQWFDPEDRKILQNQILLYGLDVVIGDTENELIENILPMLRLVVKNQVVAVISLIKMNEKIIRDRNDNIFEPQWSISDSFSL